MIIGIKATGPDGRYRRRDFARGLVHLLWVWLAFGFITAIYTPWGSRDPVALFAANVLTFVTLLFLPLGLALFVGVLSGDPALPRALRLLGEEPPTDEPKPES